MTDCTSHSGPTGVEPRCERSAGVTLIEATIVIVMVAILSIMIVQSMRSLAGTQSYSRNQGTIVDLTERVLEYVVRDARYAVRMLRASKDDDSYRLAIDLPTTEIAQDSRYPEFSEDGIFKRDRATEPRTGNLFVAFCSQPTESVDLSAAEDGSDMFRVDMFRVIAYFVTERENGALDLSRWSSQRMARWADLASVADVNRRALLGRRLRMRDVGLTWDSRSSADEAFQLIDQSTGSLVPVASPSRVIVQDPSRSIPRMLEAKRAELAMNGTGSSRVAVPLYANVAGAFPGGFEVKVDGTGTGRLLMVRIVSVLRRGDDFVNFAQVSRVVSLRDV